MEQRLEITCVRQRPVGSLKPSWQFKLTPPAELAPLPWETHRCVQCGSPPDGQERQVAIGDQETIWLQAGHCEWPYLEGLDFWGCKRRRGAS